MKTKLCSGCSKELPLTVEFFRTNKAKHDGFQSQCIQCRAAYNKLHYQKNKQVYVDRAIQNRKEIRKTYKAIKALQRCIVCGESDPVCIDFHHRDSSQKEYEVSRMTAISVKRLKQEISKCVPLCSNCHRKFHAGRFKLPKASSLGVDPSKLDLESGCRAVGEDVKMAGT